jgi:hypothetical protein
MLIARLWKLERSSDILTVLPSHVSAAANLIQQFWMFIPSNQKEKDKAPTQRKVPKPLLSGFSMISVTNRTPATRQRS